MVGPWRFILLLAALLAIFIAVVLISRGDTADAIDDPGPVVAVEALQLQDRFFMENRFLGRVETSRGSNLGFELGGFVNAVLVDIGEQVTAGQVLAQLDTKRLDAALREAEARVRAVEADAKLAEAELARVESLLSSQVASQRESDEAVRVRDAALAQKEAAEAAVERIRQDLRKSQLVAPFAGTVVRRQLDEGSVAGAGEPVLALLETDRLRIRVGVAKDIAGQWEPGTGISVEADGKSIRARVETIVPAEDRNTRTLTVLATPLTPADAALLRHGETVQVIARREVGGPVFAVSPQWLVEAERGLWGCYVIREIDGVPRAELRSVEVLHLDGDQALVRGSLVEGEQVVVAGVHKLVPGMRVRIGGNFSAIE